jgi:hypothetical protein
MSSDVFVLLGVNRKYHAAIDIIAAYVEENIGSVYIDPENPVNTARSIVERLKNDKSDNVD